MKLLRTIFSSPFPTLLWVVVVLLLTLTPAVDMPLTPAWELLSFDTAAHAAVFAVLAALAWPWVRTWARRPGLLVLVGSVALGALIEVLQYAMHQGRHAEWSDLLSDSLGALAVLACIGLGGWGWRRLAASAVLLAAATLGATAQPITPRATDAPDIPRVRQTITELASAKMHGRGYVQGGERLAASYLCARLRGLGLTPLAPDYKQPFTLAVNTFPGKATLRVRTPGTARTQPTENILQGGTDFIAAPYSGSNSSGNYLAIKLVDTLALATHQPTAPQSSRPAALVLRAVDEARLHKPENAALLKSWEAAYPLRIVVVDKLTASLTSHQEKAAVIEVPAANWQLSPAANVALQLDARLVPSYQTHNLAAIVRGSTQPDSFLVVTAHYDHLGMMGKQAFFPGANDNASGVALLLELAAHYARPTNRPAYSIAFLLFGAEEAGLLGSSYFVQHPLLPLSRIKFLINLDLLGTGEEGATVVNGRLYEAAYQRLLAINNAQHYLPKLSARGRAANSDHYPFSEVGVPAFFIYTRGGSLAYHDVHDRVETLSLAGFAGAYGLVQEFLDTLGGYPAKSPD